MALGPEMILTPSQGYQRLRLGSFDPRLLARLPNLTEDEIPHMRQRFKDNAAEHGLPHLLTKLIGLPAERSQMWMISNESDDFVGFMHVFKDQMPRPEVRPPHDWVTYIVLRKEFKGLRLSTDIRKARQLAAFRHGPDDILALHSSVAKANTASWPGVEKLGGVLLNAHDPADERNEYITVNPDRFGLYWRAAQAANYVTEEMRGTFMEACVQTSIALQEAESMVSFVPRAYQNYCASP